MCIIVAGVVVCSAHGLTSLSMCSCRHCLQVSGRLHLLAFRCRLGQNEGELCMLRDLLDLSVLKVFEFSAIICATMCASVAVFSVILACVVVFAEVEKKLHRCFRSVCNCSNRGTAVLCRLVNPNWLALL